MASRIDSLTSSSRSLVSHLRETERLNSRLSERLSTGRRVNRVEQNPQAFVQAQQLLTRAADLTSYVDNVGQGTSTIQAGQVGAQAVDRLTQQLKGIKAQAQATSDPRDLEQLARQFNQISQQIDSVVGDSGYQGRNVISQATSSIAASAATIEPAAGASAGDDSSNIGDSQAAASGSAATTGTGVRGRFDLDLSDRVEVSRYNGLAQFTPEEARIYGRGSVGLHVIDDYKPSVTFLGEDAGYKNTIGIYKIETQTRADGTTADVITDARVIWGNASKEGAGGTLQEGVSTVELTNLTKGDRFGFFLVTNGADRVAQAYTGSDGQISAGGLFEFRNADGSAATLDSTAPRLYATKGTGSTGDDLAIGAAVFTDGIGSNAKLNFRPQQMTQASFNDGSGVYFGFEDLGDETVFNDVVFRLNLQDVPEAVAAEPPSPVSTTPENQVAEPAAAASVVSAVADDTDDSGLIVQADDNTTVKVRTHDLRSSALGIPQNVTAAQLADESFLANLDVSLDRATQSVRAAQSDQGLTQATLQVREDFARTQANINEEGANKLTEANAAAESARATAGQTRQQLGVGALGLSAQFEKSILSLFRR